MNAPQSLEEFYRQRLQDVPTTLHHPLGHFNLFDMSVFAGPYAQPIFYSRKNYFKISLLTGKKKLTYADKVITIQHHALIFSNPLIPYTWELLEEVNAGYFCLFTPAFFQHFGHIQQYPVFQPGQVPVFPLDEGQHQAVQALFLDMRQELASDYAYKHDRLRNLTFELIHQGLKLSPASVDPSIGRDADSRLTSLFTELLERQFPLETDVPMPLQTPSDFAHQLAVHVNHLNRSLKATTGQTTSQLIRKRMAQEAAFLVKHSSWSLMNIGWSLGFENLSSFSHFFRQYVGCSPRSFRQQPTV